jgi:23S rRNA (pseudouridine1915-N3)-methyltransferase
MPLTILCVGKLKEQGYRAAADEYARRISRYSKLEILQIDDIPEPSAPGPAADRQVTLQEGSRLLSHIRASDTVIALCIDAPQMGSEEFAGRLAALAMRGGRTVFVIGGSLGLGDNILSRADERLSLSRMTLPHQLARVMLLEQVYRACKINAGERYHK